MKLLLAVLAIILIAGCSRNSLEVMADCESQAYDKIGVRSGDAAIKFPWLQSKAELVRVCMEKNGFKYNPDHDTSYYVGIRENYLRMLKDSGATKEEIQNQADYEMNLIQALDVAVATNWVKN